MADLFKKIFGGADMGTFNTIFDYIFDLIKKFFVKIFNQETGLDETTAAAE